MMSYNKNKAAIECMLFVAGDPVPVCELERVLNMTELEIRPLLFEMEQEYAQSGRGICIKLTEETAQLCSNREYAAYVENLMQPAQSRTFSQSLLETLAIIAYRQPVTRADVEAIRGVRCEYAVSQLVKLNMIEAVGRKDVIGRPVLYATTDAFLRQFGLYSVTDLPDFAVYSNENISGVSENIPELYPVEEDLL